MKLKKGSCHLEQEEYPADIEGTSSLANEQLSTPKSSGKKCHSVLEELEEVRALFPAPMIEAANSSFVQVVIM